MQRYSDTEPVFVNLSGARESIPLAYVLYIAWRAGTTIRVVEPARNAMNRFLDFLKVLQIPARYVL
jgi:hypothetical protein